MTTRREGEAAEAANQQAAGSGGSDGKEADSEPAKGKICRLLN